VKKQPGHHLEELCQQNTVIRRWPYIVVVYAYTLNIINPRCVRLPVRDRIRLYSKYNQS